MTTKIESEILGHLIHDHMKKEEKALTKLLDIDTKLVMETDEKEIKFLQRWREDIRQKAMVQRHWLKEIAPLVGWTVKSFRGVKEGVSGMKIIHPTKFEEW